MKNPGIKITLNELQNKQLLQIFSTESLFFLISWTAKFSLYEPTQARIHYSLNLAFWCHVIESQSNSNLQESLFNFPNIW